MNEQQKIQALPPKIEINRNVQLHVNKTPYIVYQEEAVLVQAYRTYDKDSIKGMQTTYLQSDTDNLIDYLTDPSIVLA